MTEDRVNPAIWIPKPDPADLSRALRELKDAVAKGEGCSLSPLSAAALLAHLSHGADGTP